MLCHLCIALPFLPWCHHSIAHVRAFIVVEIYDATYDFPCFLHVLRSFHAIQPFLLYDAVHAFRYGVVGRLVVLCHRDGGTYRLQQLHIGVAAILRAAVRMVYQLTEISIGSIFYPHF